MSCTCSASGSRSARGTQQKGKQAFGPSPCSGRGWPTVLQQGWCCCFCTSGAEPGMERAHTWGRSRGQVAQRPCQPLPPAARPARDQDRSSRRCKGFDLCKMREGRGDVARAHRPCWKATAAPRLPDQAWASDTLHLSAWLSSAGRALCRPEVPASSEPDAASPFTGEPRSSDTWPTSACPGPGPVRADLLSVARRAGGKCLRTVSQMYH